MSVERSKDDVLVLRLSRYHSLDLVRLPHSRKYRVVFAERWGVQRRAFVEISFSDALRVSKFLANIEDRLQDSEEGTDPGRPENMPPAEVRCVAADDEAVPTKIVAEDTRPVRALLDPEGS